MKYIISVIQPSKLDAVREALSEFGASGMTVSEVRGYGRQLGKSEIYRGAEYEVMFIPKIKLEVAVASEAAKEVVDAIRTTAATDKIGDGKIFIMDLEQAVRIRTGEEGSDAL